LRSSQPVELAFTASRARHIRSPARERSPSPKATLLLAVMSLF
jgi:hypothetical protein